MCMAVPGKILKIEDRDGTLMSVVDFGGIAKDVCLQYMPDAEVGQYVIAHAGFVIQRLDEESAIRTLVEFERLGELDVEVADRSDQAAARDGIDNFGRGLGANSEVMTSLDPVCIAPPAITDRALKIATRPNVVRADNSHGSAK
jgi:hydrogenase expression/formation protein HypC